MPPHAQPVETTPPRRVAFEFHGSGDEYFRVWFVNIMLSIITLGIYSAWAKVRNKQYFYGNTRLDGSAFEYTASPIDILKGRVVLVVAFLAYAVIATLFPQTEPLMAATIVVLIPWVVVRALAFNARYSSHRNVRFGFDDGYLRALAVYILLPILGLLTLGLAYPWAAYHGRRFFVGHSRYGATRFSFEGTVGPFYVIYLKALAILAAPTLLSVAVWTMAIPWAARTANGEFAEDEALFFSLAIVAWMAVASLVFLLGLFVVSIYLQTAVGNYSWQRTRLRENRFDLRLEFPRMLWIQLSNLALIIVTFGLMIPFAKVRIARYRLERMAMLAVEDPDEFAAGERDRISALGAELGEALDIDLAM